MMQRGLRVLASLAGMGCAAACATPQSPLHVPDTTVYQGTNETMQYRSPLPRDAHVAAAAAPQAIGVSCTTTIAFPPLPPALFYGSETVINALPWPSFTIGAGDRGYAEAMRQAREAAGAGTTLFDVRADLHTTSVLSMVRRDCTEVHASMARAASAQ